MITYSNSDCSKLTIQGNHQVTFKNFEWNVDATFDFSRLHPNLHQSILNSLVRQYNVNNSSSIKESKDTSWFGRVLNWRIF